MSRPYDGLVTDIQSTTSFQPSEGYTTELVRRWDPPSSPRALVVLVHGLAEHSGRYEAVGAQLAEAGFAVVAPDLFGFGESGGDRASVTDWDHYLAQVESLISEADMPVVLLGHSMGGLVCSSYALSDRVEPDLLVLSAPAIGGGAAWQKALAPLLARLSPGTLVPNRIKGEQLSRNAGVGEKYFADPLVFTKTTARLGNHIFTAQEEVGERLGSLSIPTLVMHGGADTIVAPSSTAPLGDMPGVERRLYPKLRHEIFNEPEGTELVAEIIEWINSRLD
jgi:acylglycerol lipase